MFPDGESRVKAIELWAIANIFSGVAETAWSQDIVSDDLHLTFSRLDLSRDHFEHCRLSSARDTQESKAFTVLQAKGDSLHCLDILFFALNPIRKVLFGAIDFNWCLIVQILLDILLFVDDVLVDVGLVLRWFRFWHFSTQFPETAIDESDDEPPARQRNENTN